ncbi:efflux RND transporter permease subunit [candidate division CSSED10-310 bacterium]|uniref:Efflux RND transporter permease subunit n=1 Tax=candidate division CSSED10-310 bacterium TaxID=2855610 RepID=A0ABV6YZ40_UNCC1
MKLIDLSVNRPVTVSMIIAILLFMGIISLQRIPIDLFPDIQKPVVRIQTRIPGSGPREVEQMVTQPIEREIATTENLVQMTSVSVEGRSEIRMAFRWNTNLDAAMMDLRQKLDMIRLLLPDEAEKPEIERFDPSADPILILDMSGPLDPDELRIYAEDHLAPHFDRVPGVAAVQVSGGAKREIRIEIDPDRLSKAGLTFNDVATVLRKENVAQPSGRMEEGRRELLVRTIAELRTAEQIGRLVLAERGSSRVRLQDVARVHETIAERREFARLDGQDCVQLEIFKENEANTLNVIDALQAKLKEIPLRKGIAVKTSYDQSMYIRDALGMVRTNAYIGGILAALILLLFLRNFRSAIIVSISMPVSILASFVPLYFTGISLNIFSLAGLALAVGLIVDNSIVILENIFRHMSEGASAHQASLTGTKEVETAVLASTTTTLAVFLPIVFVSGMAGQVFRDLSFSVAYVLGISELVAISLIPLAAARIFKRVAPLVAARKRVLDEEAVSTDDVQAGGEKSSKGPANVLTVEEQLSTDKQKKRLKRSRTEPFFNKLSHLIQTGYIWILTMVVGTLIRRVVFITIMALLFLITMYFLPALELFPRGSQRDYRIRLQAPPGLALEEADKVLKRAEQSLITSGQTETVSSTISDEGGVIKTELVILLKEAQTIPQALDNMHQLLVAQIPAGHSMEIQPISLLDDIMKEGRDPRTYGDIVFQIEGESLELLEQYTRKTRHELEKLPMIAEVMDTIPARKPEIRLILDRRLASDLGIRASELSETIQRALSGEVATSVLEGGRHIDIRIISQQASVASIEDIARLPLLVQSRTLNRTVPISRIARIERSTGPVEIQHYERQRVLYATARIASNHATGEALELLTNTEGSGTIDAIERPPGIRIRLGGAAQTMVESFSQLYFALAVAVVLVYMIMAAQFESLIHPFVVMFSVPLSLIGASLGLHFGNQQLSVTAFIGIIVLVGIAVNDAILLVSTTNLLRLRGLDRWEAITLAGQQRLRPIFMTTLTTVFGMIPLAWGLGPGSEFYEPLALVVIFGLLFATFLTLVLIPAVYVFIDDFGDILTFGVLRIRMTFFGWKKAAASSSDEHSRY